MPREKPRAPGLTKLKAWYTVPELAAMAGTDRWDMRRTLKAARVRICDRRKAGRVYLVDLKRDANLWASIIAVVTLAEAASDPDRGA